MHGCSSPGGSRRVLMAAPAINVPVDPWNKAQRANIGYRGTLCGISWQRTPPVGVGCGRNGPRDGRRGRRTTMIAHRPPQTRRGRPTQTLPRCGITRAPRPNDDSKTHLGSEHGEHRSHRADCGKSPWSERESEIQFALGASPCATPGHRDSTPSDSTATSRRNGVTIARSQLSGRISARTAAFFWFVLVPLLPSGPFTCGRPTGPVVSPAPTSRAG